jgi:predicted O-methyltransferase YrrM
MTSFGEAWASVADIKGWLTEGQARMLYEAAARVSTGAIVEIGSHHGRSTVILASAKQPDATVVAIDPYDTPRWGGGQSAVEIFWANLSRNGVQEDVTLIQGYGSQAGETWEGAQVGALFVDGAHDYESVLADLEAWAPHLAADATVLMHDAYLTLGVTRAAFKQMFMSSDFLYTGHSRSLIRFERRAGSSAVSRARMIARLPWLGRNLAIKLARRNEWRLLERSLGSAPGTPLA